MAGDDEVALVEQRLPQLLITRQSPGRTMLIAEHLGAALQQPPERVGTAVVVIQIGEDLPDTPGGGRQLPAASRPGMIGVAPHRVNGVNCHAEQGSGLH